MEIIRDAFFDNDQSVIIIVLWHLREQPLLTTISNRHRSLASMRTLLDPGPGHFGPGSFAVPTASTYAPSSTSQPQNLSKQIFLPILVDFDLHE